MKSIRKIVNRLYVLYVGMVFFLPTLIILPIHGILSIFAPRTRLPIIYRVHRIWVGTWEWLTGIHFRVSGKENIHPGSTYVMVANHTNMLDIPMVGSHIFHPWVSLIKKELKYIPLVGYIISLIAIPVDRSNPESRKQSLNRMVETLKSGISILIFPEGTRNSSEAPLKRFFSGAFKVAMEADVAILPMVITHSRPLNPPRSMELYPGTCYLHILPPIDTQDYSPDEVESLKLRVHQLIERELIERDPTFRHLKETPAS